MKSIKKINMVMHGLSVRLDDCPPGLFLFGDTIGFSSEYGDFYCVESGEYFWGGTTKREDRRELIVVPLIVEKDWTKK